MNQPPYAEYPRPGNNVGPGYGRGPGVYFDAIGEAWNIVRADLGTWIAATIVWIVIYYGLTLPISFVAASVMPSSSNDPAFMGKLIGSLAIQLVLSLIPTAIQSVMGVGMIAMGVRKSRGEYINISMIFEPFKSFGTVAGAALLYWLIYYASTLACLLPVLFFGPVLFLMATVAYLRQIGPVEALSLTFDTCRTHWAGLLGLAVVSFLLILVGVFACGIGALFAVPIVMVVYAIHYRAFFESNTSVPSQWN